MPDEAKNIVKDSIAKRYAHLEKQLSDGRPYLTGDKVTIADIYLFVITNWAKPTGLDLSAFPGIQALAGRIAARPATQAALKAEGLLKAA
jgi:glutathione S-transferase